MRNRPVVISVIAAFLALIITDTGRQAIEKGPPTRHAWALAVLLVGIVGAVAAFRHLLLTQRTGIGESAFPGVLVVMAMPPTVLSLALAFLGAPVWSLWLGFAATCGLLIWAAAYARSADAS